jgi:hemoglobin-like flavoprotein
MGFTKHKIVKKRINKLAEEMGEFTTQEMYDKLFYYPNNEGRLFNRRRQVTKPRLQNFLLMDKQIGFARKSPDRHINHIWKWIGDDENE